jgi:hypothetical protein
VGIRIFFPAIFFHFVFSQVWLASAAASVGIIIIFLFFIFAIFIYFIFSQVWLASVLLELVWVFLLASLSSSCMLAQLASFYFQDDAALWYQFIYN